MAQEALAERVGISRQQLANIETGRTALRFANGWELCRHLNVNAQWLASGRSPMSPALKAELPVEFIELHGHRRFAEVCMDVLAREPWWDAALLGAQGLSSDLAMLVEEATRALPQGLKPAYVQKLISAHEEFRRLHPEALRWGLLPEDEREPAKAPTPKPASVQGPELTAAAKAPMRPAEVKALVRRLKALLKTHRISQNAAAKQLGVTRQAVNLWFVKGQLPSGEVALRVEAWLRKCDRAAKTVKDTQAARSD
jgi:DNA-binding XRE family transcriptional regulator